MAQSETCARCGQEVRWGTRDGVLKYHHRERVDHEPAFGNIHARAVLPEAEVETEKVIPPIEVHAHEVDPSEFAPQSGIRQIANLVTGTTRVMPNGKSSKSLKHPPMAPGWELVNLTHSRGPYMGSRGDALSISDCHVLRARAHQVDGSVKIAVASWRDGDFEFAYIGTIKDGRLAPERVSSDAMKQWIKGTE